MNDLHHGLDAFSAPDLLIRPMPSRHGGPQGYLLSLAEANCMTLFELRQMGARFDTQWLMQNSLLPEPALDPDLHQHVGRMAHLLQNDKRIWNHRYARFCPVCLAEDPTWHAGWELMFHDACPRHGVWLVDQCSSCRQPVSWRRESLLRCQCGSDLRQESSGTAPTSLCQLAELLEARLFGKTAALDSTLLNGLDLEQIQRLIRYLGGYLDPVANPKPLKLRNAALLQASWPVSMLAAEILVQWPQAFHDSWSRMQDQTQGAKVGLKGAFKQAHYYLYKGLKESAFMPVRDAFEAWLSANWKGTLSQRNRNLAADLLKDAQWIPGRMAAERAGISMNRLRGLIREGIIEGQESVSTSGRRFVVIRRDQLEQIDAQLANEMTMTEAMHELGISKTRMQRLIKLLFPNARRINDKMSMPWCVPRSEVEAYLSIGDDLPVVGIPEENQVSLAHVLKYWAWKLEEVINLVEAVSTGKMKLKSLLDTGRGINRWVFDTIQLRAWHANLNRGQTAWLSIPEVARILSIKQQVAYWLAQNGFLLAEKLTNPGLGSWVRREELERFRESYIFARDVAKPQGKSSTKLMRVLSQHGIYPLRGHSAEPCRQLVYRRDEIRRFLLEIRGDPDAEFRLIGVVQVKSDERSQ